MDGRQFKESSPEKKSSSRNWEDLPEDIIQHIQSFLYEKEEKHHEKSFVKSSLVSKSWLRAWSTHPCLTFCCSGNWLDDTLSRYVLCNLLIKRFRFYELKHCPDSNILARWFNMARRSGVEEISLKFYWRSWDVPRTVFATKTLQTLSLCSCRICLYDDINLGCRSLKNLKLVNVSIDDQAMNNLFSSCPLIQTLIVLRANGIKKINPTGLHGLRVFEFEAISHRNQAVELFDAANISSTIAYNGYKYLTCLKLTNLGITDAEFNKFSSRFPFLVDFSLESCQSLERINIAFDFLSRLTLRYCLKIKEVRIDAPNLRVLDYRVTINLPEFVFRNVSQGQLEYASLTTYSTYGKQHDSSWFLKLSEVLQKSRMSDIYVDIDDMKEMNDFEVLRFASFPPKENVRSLSFSFFYIKPTKRLEIAMESFLSICRPKYISLQDNKVEYIKFMLKMLDERQSPSCCVDHEIKCWRHYLQDVKVGCWSPKIEENNEQFHEIRQREKAVSWESLPEDSLIDNLLDISIKLKWVS